MPLLPFFVPFFVPIFVASKSSGTRSRKLSRPYRCSVLPTTSTGFRLSISLLFQVPGRRITRARSKVESRVHPWAPNIAWRARCHHWVVLRADSLSSGQEKSQTSSKSHQAWRPCPLFTRMVGSNGSWFTASIACLRVGGSRSDFACTGCATSISAHKPGIPATCHSLSRFLRVSLTPPPGASPTPV